jgi:hypothetical protein
MACFIDQLLLVIVGGIVGFTVTFVFGFTFYGVPFTSNGVIAVLTEASPIGFLCGCMAGGLIVRRMDLRGASRKNSH